MMKATINGINVEGTPQEIAEYLKIMDDMRRQGVYIKPLLGTPPHWLWNVPPYESDKYEYTRPTITCCNHAKM